MMTSEEHRTFPNAFEATLLVVVLFALQILVAFFVVGFDLLSHVNGADFSGVIAVAGNGLLFALVLSYKKLRYRELFHSASNSITATLGIVTLPILLLVPGLVIAAGTLNTIVVKLLPMTSEQAQALGQMVAATPIALLFGCVIAPFLEEMLFRGIILRSFLQQYSRTAAILGSSVLFGIAHLNAYQFISAMSVGIVAGWLYERTRSLWPCVVLHAAYNAFVVGSYALFDRMSGHMTVLYAAAFSIAILAALFLLRVLMPARRARTSTS